MNRYTKMLLAGVASAGLAASMSVFPAVAGDLPYERLADPSGVETSLAVAKHTWGTDWKVVYVASNRNPVDALSAATIGDGPVVLTDGSTLNLGGVKPGKIVLLGGTGAVPQAIEDQAKATGAEVVRLAGANRYETAFAIAQQAKGQKSGSNVYLASGTALKDAMVAGAAKDGVILLSPPNGEGVKAKADALGATKLVVIGGTGVMPDATVTAAATGIIPKPKLKDMPLEQMQAAYPLAGEIENLSVETIMNHEVSSESYDYCIGNTGASIAIPFGPSFGPIIRVPESTTGLTPEKYWKEYSWMGFKSLEDAQKFWNEEVADGNNPSVLNGFGSTLDGSFFAQTKRLRPAGNQSDGFYQLSQCRKGAEHPEWTKPFPTGKRLERIGADNSGSYSCAADEDAVKCFRWKGKKYQENDNWNWYYWDKESGF